MLKTPLRLFGTIRNFLFSNVNREFLVFLFFLALSGAFWLTMALNETYERELKVPVQITNVPQNVVVTSRIQDTVKVMVRDKGFSLLPFLYGNRLQTINVNFDTFANRNTGYGVVPSTEIVRQFSSQLHGASKIVSVKPDRMEFYFNFGESKKVPIRLRGNVKPADKYYLAGLRFSPNYITVYANRQALDSIHFVQTEKLNITDFADTLVRTVSLKRLTGVKVVPAKVKLTLYPDILTENSVEVPITPVNLPKEGDKNLRLFPSRVKVHFVVGAALYRTINPDLFKVEADYNDLGKGSPDKCRIYLRSYPHGIFRPQLELQEVDYLIEQSEAALDKQR